MGTSNTTTVNQTLAWIQPFVGWRELALGSSQEPALTSANLIVQLFQAPPLKWNWNRAMISFLTYDTVNPWVALTSYALGYRLKDSNGNMQTVTTAGTSGASVPSWSTTNGGTTVDGVGSLVWTMSPITDYLVNIPTFGFLEQAFVVDSTGNVMEITKLTLELTFDNGVGRATAIAPVMDDNNGNITFRFMPGLPDQNYTIYVIYQNRAVKMPGINSIWPLPDYLAPVYDWGMMALMMLFVGDGRFTWANQKFVGSLLAISEGLSEQEKQIFLDNWASIKDQMSRLAAKGQQGYQGREV